jgi:hypothetical protein
MFNLKKERAHAQIKFALLAQFIPTQPRDWGNDQDREFSSFSTLREVTIVKPLMTFPSMNLQQKMTHNIGGLFGLGASQFTAEVLFEKNEFYNNDKPRLRVTCDNSQCRKALKEFKIKLFRTYSIMADGNQAVFPCNTKNEGASSKGSGYVAKAKFPGCKAKETVTRELEL